jgi:hypothetical protein
VSYSVQRNGSGGGAHPGRRRHRQQVLAPQPRRVAAGVEVVKAHRHAGDHRERERGAEDPPTALTHGAIDLDHSFLDFLSA